LKKETPQTPPNKTSPCSIEINGQRKQASVGQTVAAALTEANVATLRHTPNHAPRGLFCGMGVCFECLVTINDIPEQRACMTLIEPGMKIETDANAEN
jgi:predicted molibdopterin-dependent oxidoreductase YjgC